MALKIVGTVEARMGSSRLPGKTLMEIFNGMTLLECVVSRFKLCKRIDEVVVATSVETRDDCVAELCSRKGISCIRGSEDDVLERVVSALVAHNADVCVQYGADSAYLDFNLADHLVDIYLAGDYDYVCNDLLHTFPIGIYAHVVNAGKLLELNKRKDLTEKDRVDVVRYIYEHPQEYSIYNLESLPGYGYPELRLTIDYPEDLQQAKEIYQYFNGFCFTITQLFELYSKEPNFFARTKGLIQHSIPFQIRKEIR